MTNFITKILFACFMAALVPNESSAHCHPDDIRKYAREACERGSFIFGLGKTKRQINQHEYQVENIKARTKDHRSFLIARKITSTRFPKGAYLLIHYPFAKHLFFSRNNEIVEDSTFDLIMSNEIISNDIVSSNSNDLSNKLESSINVRENGSMKNKYSIIRSKRNTGKDNFNIFEACCPGQPMNDRCLRYLCSD